MQHSPKLQSFWHLCNCQVASKNFYEFDYIDLTSKGKLQTGEGLREVVLVKFSEIK